MNSMNEVLNLVFMLMSWSFYVIKISEPVNGQSSFLDLTMQNARAKNERRRKKKQGRKGGQYEVE